jgi:hypothetical protein
VRSFLPLVVALGACSDPRSLVVEITPGHESEAFSEAPAITTMHLAALDADGGELLTASAAPGGNLDLGELPVDQLLHFEVRGEDGDGEFRVRGRSLAFLLGALQSEVLGVFAQRVERWSRPPGELTHSHKGGVAAALGERYLLLTGGEGVDGADAATVAFYDLFALGGSAGGTLSFVPRSIAISADGGALLAIGDERAIWLDFDSSVAEELDPPTGLGSFASIAGGATIEGPNATYIVGPTRTSAPSDRVLVISRDRTLIAAHLTAERKGAAATWIDGDGLVIAGGNADAPGAELLAEEETSSAALAFEPDATEGAAATVHAVAGQAVLVCGGPVRVLDLRCTSDCVPAELDIDLGALTACTAHTQGGRILVVGAGEDGVMASFAVDPAAETFEPLALREERVGGSVVPAPNGSLALIGGARLDGTAVLTTELLFPRE